MMFLHSAREDAMTWPVMWSFDIFFIVSLKKLLNKQWNHWAPIQYKDDILPVQEIPLWR